MTVHGLLEAFDVTLPEALQTTTTMSRRGLIKIAAGAAGGLVLGLGPVHAQQAAPPAPPYKPSAYVRIAPDGKITLYSKNPEIGQGIKTGFGLTLAEELDANWADVTVEQSPIDATVYGTQVAGGSRSTPTNWMTLRQAGAGARAMLMAAAAKQWGVPVSELTTADSVVTHAASKRSAGYGALATAAAAMPVPDPQTLKLKSRGEFKLLGKRYSGVDNPKVVSGSAVFGIDVQVPDMRIAVFQKCPAIYGKVKSANLDEIKRMRGVTDAFIVEGTGKANEILPGVAIIATDTWSALTAKRALKIVWDESQASKDSWTGYVKQAKTLSANPVGEQVVNTVGDVDAVFGNGPAVEAYYTYGFVSHAQMEPINCTAWFKTDSLEIWAPTQTPSSAHNLAAAVMGLPKEKVTVHQTRVGGGFGRRLNNDYVVEAAQISKQAGGIPVKLMWTREDDMEHDFYRPAGFVSFKAALDERGKIAAWNSHVVHFKAEQGLMTANWPATEFPALHLPAYRASQTHLPLRMPTGAWRAPGSATSAWVVQSFLHEMSIAAKRDHVEFLAEVMSQAPPPGPEQQPGRGPGLSPERGRAVILAAAERSGWGKRTLAPGRALGIAFHFSHQGHFAEVAEVSVDAKKKVTVHKVWVVGDIGPIVNLSAAENQCEGSVIDGISTLALEVTMEKGQIQERNFDKYPIARITVAPEIDVHFLDTDYPPTGVGEPALPPLAPAVCNAIHAATGHRIRTLPITREGYSI